MAFTPEYTGDAALGFTGDRDFDDMIRDEQARQSAAQFRQYVSQQQAAGNPAYQDYIYGLPGGKPGQLEAGVNVYGMRGPEYEVIPYSTPEEYLAAYNTMISTPVPNAPSTRRGLFGTPFGLLASLAIPFAAPAVGGLLGLGSGITAGIGGGAALGGGLSAIGGQDPLRGALLGGLSGGLGSLGTAVPSESLVSAVPATIPETLAGAIRDPLLRGAVQGSLNTGAVAAANEIVGNSRTPPYIPPGQGTVPERVVVEARVPVPGPGTEDFPIVLGDVQDILDVIRGGGARPPTPQLPTVSAPTPGGVAEEVLGIPSEVIEEVLDRIPSGGGGGGAPQEDGAPIPPVPGEAEDEAAPLVEETPPPGVEEEPMPPGTAQDEEPMPPGTIQDEDVVPGTQQPEPDLGSAMGLMGLLAQPGAQVTAETPEGADIRIYDLENLFGVSGLDNLYNAPFQDELTLITEELLKAARERR